MTGIEQFDSCIRHQRVGVLRSVPGDAQPGQCPAAPRSRVDRVDLVIQVQVNAAWIAPLVPGLQVIEPVGADVPRHAGVEDLAHPRREVPVPGEEFRQRNRIGN